MPGAAPLKKQNCYHKESNMKAKKAKDDVWVKIRILKHIISVYGSYFPGVIVTVPERTATNWVKNDIAELTDPEVEVEAAVVVEAEVEAEVEEIPDVPAVVTEEDPISDPVEVEAEVEVAEVVAEVVKPKRAKRVRKSRKKE